MTTSLHETAHDLASHGIRVIPVRGDGSKAPALKAWQKHETSAQDIDTWFTGPNPYNALGIVTGPASGNLELVEIEGPYISRIPDLTDLAANLNIAELWARLSTGWLEQSPSGGLHWLYRVEGDPIPGNTKLAQDENRATIAETRGANGQVVAAPSSGQAHETGKPWTRLAGGPATVPTITWDEREAFHGLLATLDNRPHPDTTHGNLTGTLGQLAAVRDPSQGSTPPDDYETKTTWPDILLPLGWTIAFQRGNTTYWTRPGKKFGVSATTGHADDRDRLYVFSSNADPFPDFEPITKFHAYTLLEHGGDSSAAARALRKNGYGEPARPPVHPPAPAPVPAVAVGSNVVPLHPTPTPQNFDARSIGLTDDSNALAFIRDHGPTVRYNSDHGRWLTWDGHKWAAQPGTGGRARELAKQTARNLPETGPDGDDKTLRHKRYSLSERGISSLLNQARTDQTITVTTDDLDAHPWELNTPGGIVNLRTGELTPANPEHLHTRSTTTTPNPDADPTMWDRFLEQTFPDPHIRSYVQRLIGYSVVGEVREHVLPFAHGSGGNGKGVLLETVRAVLGTYAGTAPAGFLMANPYQQHATELADLAGRRFVICSEVNENDRFDEAKMKALTGGDSIKARFMRQDFFEFKPTHHLWLMGNHQPGVDSGGDGFWRRLRLIPFTHKVPDSEIIEGLQEILAAEHGPAVLQWIIDGAAAYAAMGLAEPASVRAATAAYEADVDVVGKFLDERCHHGPSYTTQTAAVAAVRAAYEEWCRDAGERPLTGRAFTSQLARHGIKTGRDAPKGPRGARMYGGLLLRATEPELSDTHDGDRGGF